MHDRSAAPERRPLRAAEFGKVIAVDGSHATICVDTVTPDSVLEMLSVGKLVVIRSAQTRVICLVFSNEGRMGADGHSTYIVEVEILGEIRRGTSDGAAHQFDRGVSSYPHIGAEAEPIRRTDLETIYSTHDGNAITIGSLVQDSSIKATVRTDDLMQKHFAVLGTTGVGKSSAVSLILSQILAVNKTTRIMLVDPHNEYRRAFGDKANVVSPTNLRLPFWLFNFEEFADVIYRGRPGVDEELDALAEYIPMARAMYAGKQGNGQGLARRETDTGFTVDTPVPYRISDVIALIDQEVGRLDGKGNKSKLKRLKARVESASRNGHYQFMFANLAVEDSMAEILMDLFRIPPDGKPVTILELAGFAPEVVDAVVSVICRMAFDLGLWSNSQIPVLVVCEEAHRYVPADRTLGFGPTRKAISRIAKEGRKYGVYLGVVTQRPAELDPTIVSQCSTIFAMRLANENDHAIIRSAVSDAAASILAFLPSIGNREAIAFGEGVSMPMRMRFDNVSESALPIRESKAGNSLVEQDGAAILEEIVRKWRTAEMRDTRPGIRSGSAAAQASLRRHADDAGQNDYHEVAVPPPMPEVIEDAPAPAAALRRPADPPPPQPATADDRLARLAAEPGLRRPAPEPAPPPTPAPPPRERLEGAPTLRRTTFGTAGLRR